MRLDPEERVMAMDEDATLLPIAQALASDEYDEPWSELPMAEHHRYLRAARTFKRAFDAAAKAGIKVDR
jgi:hypothetical protein